MGGLIIFLGQSTLFLCTLVLGIFQPIYAFFQLIKTAFARPNSPQKHTKKVKKVQEQVLEWIQNGRKTKLCNGRPWWQGVSTHWSNVKKGMTGISSNELKEIIEVDTKKQIVRVEPLMTMGELSAQLLKLGWRIPVVPEFKRLTVGGLICGAGLETSSHKYGLLAHSCVEFEVVLADGRVVNCSEEENSDVYYAIPMSLGTLGFLTSATIKILPAKNFVKLEYNPKYSLEEIVTEFTTQIHRKEGNEFVEGIMYGLDKGVIMVGNLVSENEIVGKINPVMKWYKPGFSDHVQRMLLNSSNVVEYIPLLDYYHRHDKTYFWLKGEYIPFTKNVLFRWLFGWISFDPFIFIRSLVSASTGEFIKTQFHKYAYCQDYIVDTENLKELLLLSHKETRVYPLWLCGALDPKSPGMTGSRQTPNKMMVDVGIYGLSSRQDWRNSLKKMESFILTIGGFYGPYADTFMTREEFRTMFNHDHYDKVRKQLGCEDFFPEIYDKIPHAPK